MWFDRALSLLSDGEECRDRGRYEEQSVLSKLPWWGKQGRRHLFMGLVEQEQKQEYEREREREGAGVGVKRGGRPPVLEGIDYGLLGSAVLLVLV